MTGSSEGGSPTTDLPADTTQESGPQPGSGQLTVILQLLLTLLVVRLFEIEQRRGLFTVLAVAVASSFVLVRLPVRFRPVFLTGVTGGVLILMLGSSAAAVIAIAALLVLICYLPVSFRVRVSLLIVVTAGLCVLRSGADGSFWAVVGSMFMFRLMVFLYETRRDVRLPRLSETLPYFFLLPNVCFVLFPVVDFKTWQRTREDTPTQTTVQTGVNWMVLGTVHLLMYRAIRYFFLIPPETISTPGELLRFLTANYGLYLHVAGQFHLSIGVLHLFGYRLPRTHDWFYLASSFTDIWRRINIYWKDFMSGLFFMPTFFRARSRMGERTAICVAVGVTFVATWLAHSWQTFWLLGRFPLTWQDATLWLTAGVAVGINSLLDYQKTRRPRGRQKDRETHFSVRSAGIHSLKVACVFLTVSLFWAQWTNPGLLVSLLSSADAATWLQTDAVLRLLLVAVVVIGSGILTQYVMMQVRQRGTPHAYATSQWRITGNVVVMSLLLVAAMPSMADWLPNDAARVVSTLQSDAFTQSESSRLVQGYYEELNEGSLQAAVFGHEDPDSRTHRAGSRQNFQNFIRHRNDALEFELIPGFRGVYDGETMTTNSFGMRNPEVRRSKAEGIRRVAVLGSSVVMGYGVGDDEYFCRLLEDRLSSFAVENAGGQRVEVLNFGIGKYYVIHQLRLLQEKVTAFDPDVLLYVCHQAEVFGPTLDLARLHGHGKIDDPGLLKIIRDVGITKETAPGVMRTKLLSSGPQIVDHCYRQIVAECRSRGIVPVWAFLPMPGDYGVSLEQQEIEPVARRAGFVTLEVADWADGVERTTLMIREADPHAGAAGHRRLADVLFSAIRSRSEVWSLDSGQSN